MKQNHLYNGLTSHQRNKAMHQAIDKARRAIVLNQHRGLTAVVVAAVMQDGSIILEGSGPAEAIAQLGQNIYLRAQE